GGKMRRIREENEEESQRERKKRKRMKGSNGAEDKQIKGREREISHGDDDEKQMK
ncbi:hypothetical protein GN156_23300, partial [bacterium LRH843]|nr:hypothetical protein [bacterium LRH843]